MEQVNEKSTCYLTVSFKDKSGAAAVPSTATYRVDDLGSGAQIVGDTSLTVASSIEITLGQSINTMIGAGLASETRRVTVKAVYGAGDTVNAQYDYSVVNLSGVT